MIQTPRSAVVGLNRVCAVLLVVSVTALNPRPAESHDGATPALRTDSRPVRVDLREARLTLDVRHRPWPELLNELRRETGIVLHLRPRPEGSVTALFKDVPIEQALRRLFGPDAHFVFRYDASSSVPTEAWVLGGHPAPLATAMALTHGSRPGAPNRAAKVLALANENAPDAVPALLAAVGDADPGARKAAAEAFIEMRNDAVAVDVLEQLLGNDPDPDVRATAGESLARIGSPRAIAAVRQALTDSEILVRLRVLHALASVEREPARALLQQAAQSGSEDVQSIATAILSRLETEERREP